MSLECIAMPAGQPAGDPSSLHTCEQVAMAQDGPCSRIVWISTGRGAGLLPALLLTIPGIAGVPCAPAVEPCPGWHTNAPGRLCTCGRGTPCSEQQAANGLLCAAA
jgi:hypothetical protein